MQSKTFAELEISPFLETVSKELNSLLSDLKFDKDNPQHLYSICLYCSILSISQSCVLLITNNHLVSFPILLRSLVEAHVDLINSLKDPVYFKKMYLGYLGEKKRLFKNVKDNPSNPFFKTIISSMNLDEEIRKVEDEVNRIKSESIKQLSVWDRFLEACLEDIYQFVYWNLCLYTHNNARALERRHIKMTNDSYEIILDENESLDNWLPYIDTLLGILIDSSVRIHAFLETTAESYFSALKERFDELRKRYPENKLSKIEE